MGLLLLSQMVGPGCKVADESTSLSEGLTVTEGSVNEELLSACGAYCNHVYTGAQDCSLDVLEVESAGCHAFCTVLSKSVPDQCEDLLIERYACVTENDILYSCIEEDGSPQPEEDICAAAFDEAESCLSALSS